MTFECGPRPPRKRRSPQEIADENGQLALLLVDEAATDVLELAHDLHLRSKRVLLVLPPNFELFRIVAAADDSRVPQLRDVLRRFSLPFGFTRPTRRPDSGCSRRPG